jgi:hypothetical protein
MREDYQINIKIKLAALWTSVTFCYLYGDYFELYVPGTVKGFLTGENMLNTPFKLFLAALMLAVPAVMVFFSLVMKPNINRLLNIIFGLFFTAIMLLIAIGSLEPWRAFYVFFALLESILTSCIVWYAWTWPKKNI